MNVLLLLVVLSGTTCKLVVGDVLPWRVAGRRLLQVPDPEPMSLYLMRTYLKYLTEKCGDPAKATGKCLTLKEELCGPDKWEDRDVFCTTGKNATADFLTESRARGTRVQSLQCSLTQSAEAALCRTDPDAFGNSMPQAAVNPYTLASWYDYSLACSKPSTDPTDKACQQMRSDLCKSPDISCKDNLIYEVTDSKTKRAVFKATLGQGGVRVIKPTDAKAAGNSG